MDFFHGKTDYWPLCLADIQGYQLQILEFFSNLCPKYEGYFSARWAENSAASDGQQVEHIWRNTWSAEGLAFPPKAKEKQWFEYPALGLAV